jgi:hypothetical protein
MRDIEAAHRSPGQRVARFCSLVAERSSSKRNKMVMVDH